jgi:4-hydroxy-tetrahydrodipicolinate synthase
VPVPFRGSTIDDKAQQSYARWMAAQDVAGVAVWAHTGRGPHLTPAQRDLVLSTWRAALPGKTLVAGANSLEMARDARRGGADALLAFPRRDRAVDFHAALGRELPVIAFYLYEAAGGVDYDDRTLHELLALPAVIGIKVATLDSVMTYQRIAAVMRDHPDKLLITGEDRFLGYSLMMGARAALIGMGSALTDLQAALLDAKKTGNDRAFLRLSAQLDAFGAVTFTEPMEGYIRRMLWALAADGVIPEDACDDPWGPALPERERESVRTFVRKARA